MNLKSALILSAFGIAGAANANIIISQLYGAGGNSGASIKNDYITLLNTSTLSASLNGLSLQYGSATGNFGNTASNIVVLPNVSIAAGHFYLIKLAGGANGVDPTAAPDYTFTTSINLSASAGKVLLYNGTTPVATATPNAANVLDLVGYGTTATSFEGTGPATAPSATNGITRKLGGAQDTGDNKADFVTFSATAGSFKNSASAPVPEPASIAALGLGAVAMLRRRRTAK